MRSYVVILVKCVGVVVLDNGIERGVLEKVTKESKESTVNTYVNSSSYMEIVKAEKLLAFQSQFLANHQSRVYSKEARDGSTNLLEVHLKGYTTWNYRNLNVQQFLSHSDSYQAQPEAFQHGTKIEVKEAFQL